ncbi:MAG: transglutaminaseTgpA domain-containing protein [Ilumatobacteraceae bacterium]
MTSAPSDREPGPVTARSARPYALAPGASFFVLTWTVGLGIARLTGAAAVVLVLGATLAGLVGAVLEARRSVRSIDVIGGTGPTLTTAGEPVTLTIDCSARRRVPRVLRLRLSTDGPMPVAIGEGTVGERLAGDVGTVPIDVRFPDAGVFDVIRVDVETAGASGLIWWRRRALVRFEPILVAPRSVGPMVPFDETTNGDPGDGSTRLGTSTGDVDGVRTWREGEGVVGVHWPSTLRAGSLIVHDRHVSSDRSWVVHVDEGGDAGQVRFTLDEGLRAGHTVGIRTGAAIDGSVTPVHDADDAARVSAVIASQHADAARPRRRPLRTREFHFFGAPGAASVDSNPERSARFTPAARWITALAAGLALAMLVTALGGRPVTMLLIVAGLVLGAVVTLRFVGDDGRRPLGIRIASGVATVGALAYIAVGASGVTGLLAALRGPLPDLLMLLVVLHGFEVTDRRTMRVHQAIALIVAVYAAGLRLDDQLGWWLAAWGAAFVGAITLTSSPPRTADGGARHAGSVAARRRRTRGRAVGVIGWTWLGAACAFAVLIAIPIPDGPASLGLPALSTGTPVGAPGALAGPDGSPAGSTSEDGARGSLGQAGGYRGFSETLDTSVRGDLGDDVVMRVRSPEPAFWRGQTFTAFDGRTWRVSPLVGDPQQGPNIAVPSTIGDQVNPRLETDELIQTYFVEADLPNVLFAAHRATTVIFDGVVWTRPDGALRSDVTLTDGSVYTVVSQRPRVTPPLLRAQGDVAAVFASFDDAASRTALAPYLDVPASTSARTRALADDLNPPGQSTYDTIRAYEAWIADHTAYDLDAAVPGPGVDAVDDVLFESQRGFCEQIASALTVMLRSQGVPARLATGYLSGERDRVSGVWKVRASDAHAWVEVWFPETGWEAFDPTATVPLAGDAQARTVGGDLVSAAISSIASHPVEVGAVMAGAMLLAAAVRVVDEQRRRRRRGRWGLAQDRFIELGDRLDVDDSLPTGSPPHGSPRTNPQRGELIRSRLDDPDAPDAADRAVALERSIVTVVDSLDRAAFDPTWTDGTPGADADYRRMIDALAWLERVRPAARQLTCS